MTRGTGGISIFNKKMVKIALTSHSYKKVRATRGLVPTS